MAKKAKRHSDRPGGLNKFSWPFLFPCPEVAAAENVRRHLRIDHLEQLPAGGFRARFLGTIGSGKALNILTMRVIARRRKIRKKSLSLAVFQPPNMIFPRVNWRMRPKVFGPGNLQLISMRKDCQGRPFRDKTLFPLLFAPEGKIRFGLI